jgi:hypothetical protein
MLQGLSGRTYKTQARNRCTMQDWITAHGDDTIESTIKSRAHKLMGTIKRDAKAENQVFGSPSLLDRQHGLGPRSFHALLVFPTIGHGLAATKHPWPGVGADGAKPNKTAAKF